MSKLKRIENAFFMKIGTNGRKALFDITEQDIPFNAYVCGESDGKPVVIRMIAKGKNENFVKTHDGLVAIDSFATNYLNYIYAVESKTPVLRDFVVYGKHKVKGIVYGKVKKGIPITSDLCVQDRKKGLVETSEGDVFFLDWVSCNSKLKKEIKRADIAEPFLSGEVCLNLFPKDKETKMILTTLMYQMSRLGAEAE